MDALFCQKPQDAREGLLPNIFNCGNRAQTLPRLQPNQFAEVSNEMLLGADIAGTKPIQVITVEILKLYCHGFSSHGLANSPTSLYLLPRSFAKKRTFFLKMAH